jgi:hypothetical protein
MCAAARRRTQMTIRITLPALILGVLLFHYCGTEHAEGQAFTDREAELVGRIGMQVQFKDVNKDGMYTSIDYALQFWDMFPEDEKEYLTIWYFRVPLTNGRFHPIIRLAYHGKLFAPGGAMEIEYEAPLQLQRPLWPHEMELMRNRTIQW